MASTHYKKQNKTKKRIIVSGIVSVLSLDVYPILLSFLEFQGYRLEQGGGEGEAQKKSVKEEDVHAVERDKMELGK
jgi:hypothetical protein